MRRRHPIVLLEPRQPRRVVARKPHRAVRENPLRVRHVTDHFAQASSGWKDFPALVQWLGKCKVSGIPASPIINSLW